MYWKIPPKAKIFEALSAIADGRVEYVSETRARVVSSDQSKSYQVSWSPDFKAFSSNDNASYYQGYLGYPILAVLMDKAVLPIDSQVAGVLAGINWKQLNTTHHNQWDVAVGAALANIDWSCQPYSKAQLESKVETLYEQVAQLKIEKIASNIPPPK